MRFLFQAILGGTALLGTIFVCGENEKMIPDFDAEKKSVAEMSELIRDALEEGATIVRFPSGKWEWHSLTRAEFVKKEKLEKKEFEEREGFERLVRNWLAEKKVAAVQISLGPDSPANLFFKIEKSLTEAKVLYVVSVDEGLECGRFVLSETNGESVRSE